MSLYPSLEDMKVDKVIQAQTQLAEQQGYMGAVAIAASTDPMASGALYPAPSLYPELREYMGLSLSDEEIRLNMPMVAASASSGALVARPSGSSMALGPVTGSDVGVRRAEVKQGVREVILCKDQDGKLGLRLKAVDKGIFVQLVQGGSPASLAGLRFGDQVLQINGENCAAWDTDKAHKVLKKAAPERIVMAVRDRPFERTITMHKDSLGYVGFVFKNGRIVSITKDSSAARNGLLTEHHVCELNGQNVVGLKDSQVSEILTASGSTITLTIMPSFIYDHIIKRMASSVLKNQMDHSIPEV